MNSQYIEVPVALPIWLYTSLLVIVAVLAWIRRVLSRIEAALTVPVSPYRCPDCAEPVQIEARICKSCRFQLTEYFESEAKKVEDIRKELERQAESEAKADAERNRLAAEAAEVSRREKAERRSAVIRKLLGTRLPAVFAKFWKKALIVLASVSLLIIGSGLYFQQNALHAAQLCATLLGKELPTQFGYFGYEANKVAYVNSETLGCTTFVLSGYVGADTVANASRIPNFPFHVQRYSNHTGAKFILIRPKEK